MMTYSAPPTYPKRSRRRLKTRYARRYPTAMTASAARVVCIHHATCAQAAELDGDAEHGSIFATILTLVAATLDSHTPASTLDDRCHTAPAYARRPPWQSSIPWTTFWFTSCRTFTTRKTRSSKRCRR